MASVLLLFASPLITAPAWARGGERGLHIKASYSAAGEEVTAGGTVSGSPIRGHAKPRARLQQRVGSQWLTRATGPLRAHGHVMGYSLSWDGSALGRRELVRVEIVSGRHVLGASAAHSVMPSAPVSVQSTLRSSTVQPAEGDVVSVSGEASEVATVVLAKGARVPAVGAALVIDVSAKAPNGVLGIVTALKHEPNGQTQVATKPGTLEDAYSSFDAHLNGTLGELSEHATEGSVAKAASVNLDPFSHISFSCDDSSVKASITHDIDLSDLSVNTEVTIPSWGNGYSGPGILFSIGGQPKLGLGVKFSGDEECEASVLGRIPIPYTPLMLEIGPDFTVAASGALGVELEWTPRIFYGFSRFRGEPSNNWEAFKNGGRTNFTGNANLTVSLALEVGLSLEGRVGIRGSLGPEITGDVSAQRSPPEACLSVNADFAVNLEAFANDFFNEYTFNIGNATFGNLNLYHKCTATSGGGSGGGKSGGSGGSGGSGTSPGESGGGGSGPGTPGEEAPLGVKASPNDDVSVGSEDACVVMQSGGVDCWGTNLYGQLGDGTHEGPEKCNGYPCSTVPVAVTGLTDATGVSVGYRSACALLATGGVDCWGWDYYGQLGDGNDNEETALPVPVRGITDATAVSVGNGSACAVLATGGVDCWGDNFFGGLGYGYGTNEGPEYCWNEEACSTVPVPVNGITDATGISTSCAVLATGRVDCWGPNPEGLDLEGITEAIAVSGRCALLATGHVNCWGQSFYGALGDGAQEGSSVPMPVNGIVNATTISAHGDSACATLATGAVDCWGSNVLGELGDGAHEGPEKCFNSPCSTVPVPTDGITDASGVSVEDNSACAVLTDGRVDCWGWNFNGQLGDGTDEGPEACGDYPCSTVPVPVSGLGEGSVKSSALSPAVGARGTTSRTVADRTSGETDNHLISADERR